MTRRVVVLLEGASDVAALRALLPRGAAYSAVELVDMRGVTNVRRHLEDLPGATGVTRVLGMCDAGEQGFFVQALAGLGVDVRGETMSAFGFHVCHADLEDELIRALGPERAASELAGLGLTSRFAQFRQQPAWRDRPLDEQLRRFAGVASGRKALLAEALAAALPAEAVPAPLADLLAQLEVALGDGGAGPPVRAFPRPPR